MRERKSGAIQYVRIGRGSPSSIGNAGAPSQSRGGAIIISNRCCSMWTCRSSDVKVSIGEQSARKSVSKPDPERNEPAGGPAAAIAAMQHEPAPQVNAGGDEKCEEHPRIERPGSQECVERGIHRNTRCRYGWATAAGRAGS